MPSCSHCDARVQQCETSLDASRHTTLLSLHTSIQEAIEERERVLREWEERVAKAAKAATERQAAAEDAFERRVHVCVAQVLNVPRGV